MYSFFYSKVCRFIYYFIEGKKCKTSPLTLQRAWTDLVAVNLFWSHTGEKIKKQIDIVGIATTRNLQCLQWSVCAFISCIIYLSRGRDRKRSDFITDQDVLPCALAINLKKWQADAHLTIPKLRLTNNCLTLNMRLVTPAEILKLMSNPFGCIEQHMSVWGKYSIYYLFYHEYFISYINGLSYLIFIFRLGLLVSLQCNIGQVCFENVFF